MHAGVYFWIGQKECMPFPVHAVSIWTYEEMHRSNRRGFQEAAITSSSNSKHQTISVSFPLWQTLRICIQYKSPNKNVWIFWPFQKWENADYDVLMNNHFSKLSKTFESQVLQHSSKLTLLIFFDHCQWFCPKWHLVFLKVHTLVMSAGSQHRGTWGAHGHFWTLKW